jgi:hypothetical protein
MANVALGSRAETISDICMDMIEFSEMDRGSRGSEGVTENDNHIRPGVRFQGNFMSSPGFDILAV